MSSKKKKQHKERERKDRIRKEKHEFRSQPEIVRLAAQYVMPEAMEDDDPEPEPPPLGRRFASERLLSRMKRMMDTKQLSSVEEMNQELERLRE